LNKSECATILTILSRRRSIYATLTDNGIPRPTVYRRGDNAEAEPAVPERSMSYWWTERRPLRREPRQWSGPEKPALVYSNNSIKYVDSEHRRGCRLVHTLECGSPCVVAPAAAAPQNRNAPQRSPRTVGGKLPFWRSPVPAWVFPD
jgi:hypothetical protein